MTITLDNVEICNINIAPSTQSYGVLAPILESLLHLKPMNLSPWRKLKEYGSALFTFPTCEIVRVVWDGDTSHNVIMETIH